MFVTLCIMSLYAEEATIKATAAWQMQGHFFQAREQAGAGLAGGFLYGKHKESEQKAYQQGYQAGQQSR